MRLPSKPSALITLALNDLRKVERSKNYKVNMEQWHSPRSFISRGDQAICQVCLAGAVMAKTFKCSPGHHKFPDSFGDRLTFKFDALDSFRTGEMASGLTQLGISETRRNKHMWTDRDIPGYRTERKGFYRAMRKMAREFKAVGL